MSGQVLSEGRGEPVLADFPELLRGIDGVLWEADARTFQFLYVSPQTRTILGYEPEEWLASPTFWADHLHPADREWAVNFCVAQTGQGRDHDFEYRMIAKDGRVLWMRDLVWVVPDEQGRALRLRGLLTDITRRKSAEERAALQQECTSILALGRTVDEAFPSILEAVARRLGWSAGCWWRAERGVLRAAALIDHAGIDVLPASIGDHDARVPSFPAASLASGASSLESDTAPGGGRISRLAVPVRGRSGPLGVIELVAPYLVQIPRDDIVALEGLAAQVAAFIERENAQRELRERERRHLKEVEAQRARLDAIIMSVPGVVWEAWGEPDEAHQRIDFVSEHVERMLGYSREEWLAKPNFWLSIVHPEDRDDAARRSAAQFASGQGGSLEFRWIHKDGRPVWVRAWNVVIKDGSGKPVGMRGVTLDISDRREAEAALEKERYLLAAVLEQMPAGIIIAEPNGKLVLANDQFNKILGHELIPAEGIEQYSKYRAFHPDGRPLAVEEYPLAKALLTGKPVTGNEVLYESPTREGRIHLLSNAAPVRDGRGQVVAGIAAIVDITDRTRAETALREKEERLRVALEASVAGTFRWDLKEGWVNLDENLVRLMGAPTGTMRSVEALARLAAPDDRDRLKAALDACAKGGADLDVEFRVILGDASVRWLLARGRRSHDAGGTPHQLTGACLDITVRKTIEEELRQRGILLSWQRRVLESIATGAPLHETLEILCREAEIHAPEHHFTVLLADEDGKRLRHGAAPSLPEHYNKAVDGIPIGEGVGSCGTAAFRKEPVIVRDIATDPLWREFKGLALPIGLRACWSTPILGSDGELLGTWAVYRTTPGEPEPTDTTMVGIATRLASIAIERSRSEEQIRTQRDLVSTITDNAASALFMMDAEGYPVFLNEAAKAMTGYESIDEIKHRPLHYAVHFRKADGSPYPMEECPIDRANAEIRPLRDQREIFCKKDGTLFPVEYNVAPVRFAGDQRGAVIEVRDITAQVAAEEALRERANELARLTDALSRSNLELDQFAYVTSHDLKAPLRGIANLSRWIEEDLAERVTPESRQHLDLLRGRVNRMESLIDAILEYSRVGRMRQPNEMVDTQKLLRDTVEFISPPPSFRVEIPDEMPKIRTQRAQLQQVFMNLVGNAVKHHDKPEGTVRIGVEDAGASWRFSVSDDGPGIPARFHDRIFVIFQTLRPRDKVEGTGVGLALVKKIVESQGGSVSVESEEGKGTTFRFTWPKAPREDMA